MILSRKQAIEKFREHWRWVAAEPSRDKRGYLGVAWIRHYCFLCQYNAEHTGNFCSTDCLIKWPGGGCMSFQSPYGKWENAFRGGHFKHAQKWASKIAKLPENK